MKFMNDAKMEFKTLDNGVTRVYYSLTKPEVVSTYFTLVDGKTIEDANEWAKRRLREKIRAIRFSRQRPIHPDEGRVGLVYHVRGTFLRTRRDQLNKPKKPLNQDRHVGIEIEFLGYFEDTANALVRTGLSKHVTLGFDSSVESNDDDSGLEGLEAKICLPVSEINTKLPIILKALKDTHVGINDTCGLHIHVDVRNSVFERDLVFKQLVDKQDYLFDMADYSRQNNTYCQKVQTNVFDDSETSCHYQAISSSSYYKFKTIEVRIFESTLNINKVLKRVNTVLSIAYEPIQLDLPMAG